MCSPIPVTLTRDTGSHKEVSAADRKVAALIQEAVVQAFSDDMFLGGECDHAMPVVNRNSVATLQGIERFGLFVHVAVITHARLQPHPLRTQP
ncbi:hypothetical protein SAMN05443245_7705 [Paraburkholderia fungorum]|uniref:Uncharacterized protein n=1 Tax=Paraburkholderia fungorum TaxID=134537 RepID=A0A1H1K0P5_9BURK|nr:hypothetical protein SAMN05443245_7705 [Paraburkholderia fungorum]